MFRLTLSPLLFFILLLLLDSAGRLRECVFVCFFCPVFDFGLLCLIGYPGVKLKIQIHTREE